MVQLFIEKRMQNSQVAEKVFKSSVLDGHKRGYLSYLIGAINILNYGTSDTKVDKGTEAHIARAFEVAMSESHFRMGDDILMGYDGYKYIRINEPQLHYVISEVMTRISVGSVYIVNSTKTIASHVMRRLMHKKYTPCKHLISFRNKVVDLDTLEMHDHDAKFETHIYLDFDYDPKAKCDKFKWFLTDVMKDEPTAMVLQEFIGCMFVDRSKIKMERILYMRGGGRNGKGVMSSIIEDIAGVENRTSFQLFDLLKGRDRAYNIAEANGKLVNICADMNKDDISGGEFKTYVSGEPMSARHIYGRPFVADNPPVLIASMNELPNTTDYTMGQIERPLIIPFEKFIAEADRDPELTSKLKRELSGIFNWVVEGRTRFVKSGGKFTYSATVEGQKKIAKENSNSVMRFLAHAHIEAMKADYNTVEEISLADLYKEYSAYCEEEGLSNRRMTRNRMSTLLSDDGFHRFRRSDGVYYTIFRRNDFTSDEFADAEENKEDSLPF